MGRLLRFVAVFVLLLGAFVLVGLPLILSPLLTQMVRNSGFQAQTVNVTVGLFDPTLLFGHARKVTLVATDVDVSPAQIANINVSLGDASYFDRSFSTVSGELDDVSITLSGGDSVHLGSVTVDGPADAADATAHMRATDADHLIRLAAHRVGVTIDDVTVGGTGVTVRIHGVEAAATVGVSGGALILNSGTVAPIVLLQPAPSDPWKLQEAYVTADGLNVRAVVDMTRVVKKATEAD